MAEGNVKRTIDNLPVDLSVEYEKRKSVSESDPNLLVEADQVRFIVGKDTLVPTGASALDEVVLGDVTAPSWGGILPPDLSNYQTKRAFTGQIGPSFGPQDRLDAMSVRIQGLKDSLIAKLVDEKASDSQEKIADVEKEANQLLSLINTASEINKTIEFLRLEITRFQKG